MNEQDEIRAVVSLHINTMRILNVYAGHTHFTSRQNAC
jgi:hypothetical protein